jgi:hypothetical protein
MIPACKSNACGQDSRRCPFPSACEVPEAEAMQNVAGAVIAAGVIACVLLVLAAVFWPHIEPLALWAFAR